MGVSPAPRLCLCWRLSLCVRVCVRSGGCACVRAGACVGARLDRLWLMGWVGVLRVVCVRALWVRGLGLLV